MYNLRLEDLSRKKALGKAHSIVTLPFFHDFYFSGRDSVIITNKLTAEFGRGTGSSAPFGLGEVSKSLSPLIRMLQNGEDITVSRFNLKLSAPDSLKSKLGLDKKSILNSEPSIDFSCGMDLKTDGKYDFYAFSYGLNKGFYSSERSMEEYRSHKKVFEKWEMLLDENLRLALMLPSSTTSSFSKF